MDCPRTSRFSVLSAPRCPSARRIYARVNVAIHDAQGLGSRSLQSDQLGRGKGHHLSDEEKPSQNEDLVGISCILRDDRRIELARIVPGQIGDVRCCTTEAETHLHHSLHPSRFQQLSMCKLNVMAHPAADICIDVARTLISLMY